MKRLVVGFLLGAILLLVLGATTQRGGRYQVAVAENPAGFPFVVIARVDTATGEVVTVTEGVLHLNGEPTICLPGE